MNARPVLDLAESLGHRWWAPFPWLPDEAKPSRPLADSEELWGHVRLEDFQGAEVVDFGCHEGYHTFRALREGASGALGADKTERVVRISRAIEEHIERLGARFILADALSDLPQADVYLSLSVWHQVDPEYRQLRTHVEELQAKARRAVYLDLIVPPLKGEAPVHAIVAGSGGEELWSRRHPVRRHRTLYRLPGRAGSG